jgi:hypothetical protein
MNAPFSLSRAGQMTEGEYDKERDRLRERYADSSVDSTAKRDRALALLFYRSGWTQEKLAKKEGKGNSGIDRLVRFGRFLAFIDKSPLGGNLTERRFRDYWERTAEHGDERLRFRALLNLMQAETGLSRSTVPKGYPKKIIAEFCDGKWHPLPVIAKFLCAPEDEVMRSLAGMVKDGRGGAATERKIVGVVKHYRFFRHSKMISSAELTEKLAPIIKELKAEGRKNMATMSPATVAHLAGKLSNLLDEWAR